MGKLFLKMKFIILIRDETFSEDRFNGNWSFKVLGPTILVSRYQSLYFTKLDFMNIRIIKRLNWGLMDLI